MANALENLQSAYESVCLAIANVMADPQPNYNVDGVNMDRTAYYDMLLRREQELRAIPGVAPLTQPIFDVFS